LGNQVGISPRRYFLVAMLLGVLQYLERPRLVDHLRVPRLGFRTSERECMRQPLTWNPSRKLTWR
jgi:hypothetical protein